MKYLIISDIHGSSKFLNKVLDINNKFDKLIILGDILYHGPRNKLPNGYNPMEVIQVLNNIKDKIISVRGNCDAKIDLELLEFLISDHKCLDIDNCRVFLTHGDVYNKDNIPSDLKISLIIHGHTHKNEICLVEDKKIINIGSLSMPKDGHHTYAIIQDSKIEVYDLMTNKIILEDTL